MPIRTGSGSLKYPIPSAAQINAQQNAASASAGGAASASVYSANRRYAMDKRQMEFQAGENALERQFRYGTQQNEFRFRSEGQLESQRFQGSESAAERYAREALEDKRQRATAVENALARGATSKENALEREARATEGELNRQGRILETNVSLAGQANLLGARLGHDYEMQKMSGKQRKYEIERGGQVRDPVLNGPPGEDLPVEGVDDDAIGALPKGGLYKGKDGLVHEKL